MRFPGTGVSEKILFKIKELSPKGNVLLIILTLLVSALLLTRYGQFGTEIEVSSPEQNTVAQVEEIGSDEIGGEAAIPPAKAKAPVRFMMYNVRDYFVEKDKPRSKHTRRIKRNNEREAVADVIAKVKPEIIGLVEIGGTAALDDLAGRLAARGLHYPHRKALIRWGEDRALAILSRYPIVADNSVAECQLVGKTNRRMLRGILDVTIMLKDKRVFRIMGAHLKSRVSEDPAAAESLRVREARTLAAHIEQAVRKQPDIPILIYGDWNDGPSAPALEALRRGKSKASSLKRLNPKDDNGEVWTLFYKNGNEYSTFDQIYVNSVLSKRMGTKSKMGVVNVDENRSPSDHRAVWCEML